MPTISKEIIALPVTKAFLMTNNNNRPFVISFHTDANNHILYFNVTKSGYYPITKVPVFSGTCYSVTAVTEMLTACGCKYIKRIPVKYMSVIPQDYFEGIADGAAVTMHNPESKNSCCCNCNCDDEQTSADFLEELIASLEEFEELDDNELPF